MNRPALNDDYVREIDQILKDKSEEKLSFAAIDIGSNAVRLLIKSYNINTTSYKDRFNKELMLRVPVRLGQDVFTIGEISKDRERSLRWAMKSFKELMKVFKVRDYRICATSALRDAKNGPDIINKIYKNTGFQIEIIGGLEEAMIIYNNHVESLDYSSGNFVYVDVGGGSTEITLIVDNQMLGTNSYNVGTVRMLSGAVKDGVWESMIHDLEVFAADHKDVNIIGSGGNINKLFRMSADKDKVKKSFSVEALQNIYDEIKVYTAKERIRIYDMKPDRADVIIPASEIFLKVASVIEAKMIFVPVMGLSDGIINNLYLKDIKKQEI
ncbi:MAG: Ppx/GppA family phosphatase [Rikenellaceae bacterium]